MWGALLVAAALMTTRDGRAQSEEDLAARRQAAQDLADSAFDLLQKERYGAAAELFAKADKTFHSPVFVMFQAEALEKQGKWLAARRLLQARGGAAAVDRFIAQVKPASVLGLLLTVVLLFGFQAHVLLSRPMVIGLIAVPILIQSYGIFALAYGTAWALKVPHAIAAPCALIGTSNFFELAVAVAISLFGLNSGAALATVVGVLVEVPVMLSLVAFANRSRRHFVAGEVREAGEPS